ncbi:hypothetical protein DL770_003997 [Monosporascus sp. CRB-9-2]|nr:hypothetical protein DL770_003997 [Monosporascus sp. CRB-9-2]
MDGDPSIAFGIEIESTILGDPDPPGAYQKDRWKHNVKSLSEAIAMAGVDNHVSLVEEKEKQTYKEWYPTHGRQREPGPRGSKSENSRSARVKWLGTVEFRLASGTTRLEDAFMWIDFASLFVRAAAASSRAEGPVHLVEFVSRQNPVPGVPDGDTRNVVNLPSGL